MSYELRATSNQAVVTETSGSRWLYQDTPSGMPRQNQNRSAFSRWILGHRLVLSPVHAVKSSQLATRELRLAARSSKLAARDDHGAEIAEAALVLPLVFMFLLGIVWFGRAFNIYTTITHAAQQGALAAARASCGTCTPPNTPTPDGTDFTTSGTVLFAVASVLQSSNLDPAQIVAISNPPAGCNTPAGTNVTICRNVLLNSGGSVQVVSCGNVPNPTQLCGSMVTFQYPFQFFLPFTSLNQQRIVMSAQAESRMEE